MFFQKQQKVGKIIYNSSPELGEEERRRGKKLYLKEGISWVEKKRKLAEALQLLQTQLQVPGQELERRLAAQQKEKEKPRFLTDQTPIPLKEATISTKLHHGICTSASYSVIQEKIGCFFFLLICFLYPNCSFPPSSPPSPSA